VLSDQERAKLDEIQDQLLTEDPKLARAFEAPVRGRPTSGPDRAAGRLWARQVLLWSMFVLALLLLMAGSGGGAAVLVMLGVALSMARR